MMAAYIELQQRRRLGEQAELLTIMTAASQGQRKAIRKLHARLMKESGNG